jgi:GNAT superfamily N-acetyltransferase
MNTFEIKQFEPDYSRLVQDVVKHVLEALGFGFDVTGKDNDLQDIPKNYFCGHGNFWLLMENKKLIGTIALRPLPDGCYELKRFFIDETYRGRGYGNRALQFVIDYAKGRNIKCIRLDTNRKLPGAMHLYGKYGFYEIEPYNEKSDTQHMKWFELRL